MANSNEFNWVNHGPDLDHRAPEDRCHYVFQQNLQYEGQSVKGRPCGLPIEPFYDRYREPRCHFHPTCPREGDEEIKEKLEAAVASRVYLGEAQLAKADLRGARLVNARLPHASLAGAFLFKATFEGADLCFANLQGAELRNADLRKAILVYANLQHTSLPSADLTRADLSGVQLAGATLRWARLDSAILRLAGLQGADFRGAVLINADLGETIIAPVTQTDPDSQLSTTKMPDLRRADLRGASLWEATIAADAHLTGAHWGARGKIIKDNWSAWPWCRGWSLNPYWRWTPYHIQDERCARSDQENKSWKRRHGFIDSSISPNLGDCETIYRQLKLNYQESGDYQTAGEFFVREMECKRAQMVKDSAPLLKRVGQALMYFLCGYGERPSWIAAWAVFLVALFAFFHGWAGITNPYTGECRVGPGVAWPTWAGFTAWLSCLYFSVITFTSLGYADLSPAPGVGRALAGVEAALGIVIMSLFLICVVRKYSR